jgi:hypothetical protein
MNSFEKFQEMFGGSFSLNKMVGDKIFLAMSNLYFFNLYRGIQVDFSITFHPVFVLDFADVFPIRTATA